MSSELSILALYGLLMAITILIQASVTTLQVGIVPLVGPRDDLGDPGGMAGRCKRSVTNSVEAMALFAPAILILHALGRFDANTLLAAQIFLIARVLYVPVYLMGVPWLRTFIWLPGFLATLFLFAMAL